MIAQDVFARVQRTQMGHVVVLLLALGHDGAAAIEAAEDLRQLLVVAALDLVQCLQILTDTLVEFHRRQCGVAADARMQIAQHFGKRQAVGIEQIRCRFHLVQHCSNRREPACLLGSQNGVERRGAAFALLEIFVEQLLFQAAGSGTIAWGLFVLIGQQHDDAAVPIQLFAQLRDQRLRSVAGLVGLRDCGRCSRGFRS